MRNQTCGTRWLVCLTVVLLWLVMSGVTHASDTYPWPISSPTYVTSTLGEYRGDHLHNGIDLSTLNQRGRDVYAVDTAVVYKVMHDPEKYGKTVILKHDDGTRSWYSHLDRMSASIRDSLQEPFEAGSEFKPSSAITLGRGEVLGKAGQTGRGGLHLHFSLQKKDGTFIDPLGRFQPSLPLDVRPTVKTVRLMPLDSTGWIDGKPSDRTYEEGPRRRIEVWGRLGINVALWNRHPKTQNRSLPERIQLQHNGEVIFNQRFDELTPGRQKKGIYSMFDGYRTNLTPTTFNLNLTPRTQRGAWDGISFFNKGQTGELKVVAESRNGERTVRVLSYEVVPPPATFQWFPEQTDRTGNEVLDYDQLTKIQPASSRFLVASLTGRQTALKQYSPPQYKNVGKAPSLSLEHNWVSNRVQLSLNIRGAWKGWPRLSIRQDTVVATPPLIQVDPGHFVTWWEPETSRDGWFEIRGTVRGHQSEDTAAKRIYLQSIRRQQKGAAVSLDGRFSLFSSGNSLAFSSFLNFEKRPDLAGSRNGLTVVGEPVEIQPDYFQSEDPLVLSADLPDDIDRPGQIGLYRWNPVSNRWNLLSYQEGISDWSREARIYQGGIVTLARDNTPPEVKRVRRINNDTVRIYYGENGSGLKRDKIRLSINGHSMSYRWHEHDQWLDVDIPAETSLSNRTLRVKIADHSGRTARWKGLIKDL